MDNNVNVNSAIEELKDDIIKELQKVLRIKSVQDVKRPGMPFGEKVNDALVTTLELGKELGFNTKNVDGYMGYIEWGEGEKMVGILGHLDVVPEGDGWSHDPYGGEIHEGKVYGRGTLDDKGPIIASIFAMYALKKYGYNPNKRIRILLGTNEESGCNEVHYYLERENIPDIGFTPDGYFPVIHAEKGMTIFNLVKNFKTKCTGKVVYIKGGHRPNMVPDYCEVGVKCEDKETLMRKADAFGKWNNCEIKYEIKEDLLILKAVGISAHGSTPQYGKNAVMIMLSFLYSSELCENEVNETLKFLVENIGMETDGKTLGINLHDDVSGDLSFNIGTIEMNDNMISLGLNIRYPVTFELDNFMEPFRNKISNLGFEIQGLLHQKPLYFPKDHILIKTLLKAYREETGETADPIAIGGGTYAKEMPNIVAFGPIFPGKPDLDHKADEYIEVDDLIKMTNIYANAIKKLCELEII